MGSYSKIRIKKNLLIKTVKGKRITAKELRFIFKTDAYFLSSTCGLVIIIAWNYSIHL